MAALWHSLQLLPAAAWQLYEAQRSHNDVKICKQWAPNVPTKCSLHGPINKL